MNQIWKITLDDYEEIVKRARAGGCKDGESMEKWMIEYFKEKGMKPAGQTELNQDEFLTDTVVKHQSILDVRHDKKGKPVARLIKKRESDT